MSRDEKQPEAVSITVPSNPKFLRFIRHMMELYIEELPVPEEIAPHLILAVDEACSNIIKYAYEYDGTQLIIITFCTIDDTLKVTIRDFGKKPDISKIRPRALDDIRPGGLGTHIIRSVMDDVFYDISPETGTLLTLCKHLKPAPAKEGD